MPDFMTCIADADNVGRSHCQECADRTQWQSGTQSHTARVLYDSYGVHLQLAGGKNILGKNFNNCK